MINILCFYLSLKGEEDMHAYDLSTLKVRVSAMSAAEVNETRAMMVEPLKTREMAPEDPGNSINTFI